MPIQVGFFGVRLLSDGETPIVTQVLEVISQLGSDHDTHGLVDWVLAHDHDAGALVNPYNMPQLIPHPQMKLITPSVCLTSISIHRWSYISHIFPNHSHCLARLTPNTTVCTMHAHYPPPVLAFRSRRQPVFVPRRSNTRTLRTYSSTRTRCVTPHGCSTSVPELLLSTLMSWCETLASRTSVTAATTLDICSSSNHDSMEAQKSGRFLWHISDQCASLFLLFVDFFSLHGMCFCFRFFFGFALIILQHRNFKVFV
jgi:hypothetical protein